MGSLWVQQRFMASSITVLPLIRQLYPSAWRLSIPLYEALVRLKPRHSAIPWKTSMLLNTPANNSVQGPRVKRAHQSESAHLDRPNIARGRQHLETDHKRPLTGG